MGVGVGCVNASYAGVGYGFYVASNGYISAVKNQGSPNISTHTSVIPQSSPVVFDCGSNGLGGVVDSSVRMRFVRHTIVCFTLTLHVKFTSCHFFSKSY